MAMGSNIAIVIAFLFSLVFPFGLMLWWRKKPGKAVELSGGRTVIFPVCHDLGKWAASGLHDAEIFRIGSR